MCCRIIACLGLLLLLLPTTLLLGQKGNKNTLSPFQYSSPKTSVGKKGAVVCAHPLAAAVGVAVLKSGGNAFDAAIAVQLALAVVYPGAGNLGGGGFMIARQANGVTLALDFREKAPAAAHAKMYLDSTGQALPELSLYGHLAAGVPGTPAGLAKMLSYGKLSFAALAQYAIDLAEKGFAITAQEAQNLNEHGELFSRANTRPTAFVRERNWKAGDTLRQPELAQTLKKLALRGAMSFYRGENAIRIVQEMERGKGIITLEDLANYQAVFRQPLLFSYKNYTLITMPPPSSGGILLAQMLGMLEDFPVEELHLHQVQTMHLLAEIERRAYSDRAEHLGDSDFYPVPLSGLIAPDYLQRRIADFDPLRASVSAGVKAGTPRKESSETTHLSIVDQEGNTVSLTTTLNGSYGSGVVVGGAGFLLNNEMDDFATSPGQPNLYGLIGGAANAIAPNKRMLSSMTPTIVLKDGEPFLVLGTPGGSTIITTVFQIFLNVTLFGLTLEEAVAAPRFHHQWLPDKIFVEEGFNPAVLDSLRALGHEVAPRGKIGRVDAIIRLPEGKWQGVADPRGDDAAITY